MYFSEVSYLSGCYKFAFFLLLAKIQMKHLFSGFLYSLEVFWTEKDETLFLKTNKF